MKLNGLTKATRFEILTQLRHYYSSKDSEMEKPSGMIGL